MDYKSMITPYINSIRSNKTKEDTIRVYTRRLNESVDFLIAGNFEPDEAYYSALEAHLSENYQASTLKGWLSLVHRFFEWTITPEATSPITHTDSTSNEIAEISHSEENTQPEIEQTIADDFVHPQEREGGAGLAQEHKYSKQIKITIYPDEQLDADIKDLAGIDGITVSKFILKIIAHEVNNRKDDLTVIRNLRAKRK